MIAALNRCLPRHPLEWVAVALGAALALPAFALLAPLPALSMHLVAPGDVILAANGAVIERDVAQGSRIPVGLDEIAPAMIEATIAAEDQRFWQHPGVDPLAITRAASEVFTNPSGASTLTQQLVRRTYLREADLPLLLRKAREALYAVALETRAPKSEVLEAYLNHVYYGRGAYGVEAAAQAYFGVRAAHLDTAQAAFLAGLPQSPSAFDGPGGEAAATARQRYVLDRMVATGALDEAEADAVAATPLRVAPASLPMARHLSAMVYDELDRVLPGHPTVGLVIETTLDAGVQHEAERSVRARLARLEDNRAGSAAVVVLDPGDGRLLAVVGSADFDAPAGQINMAVEPRQPGSALKPLLYALALERGYTPASMLLDVPTTFTTKDGPYRPVNYDLKFRGPVTMRVALASSLNVPAVRTLDALGVDAFLEMTHRAGLDSLEAAEAYGLALTLGGGGVRLIDLTAAYGAFATDGTRREPWVVARVTDQAGNVLYERASTPPSAVTSPEVAFLVADMLSDPDARRPGFGPSSILDTPYGAAVKTGTSSEFRDNWTIGFTPERVVGVWVGNADQSPMVHISGVDGAAPIWRDVMTAAVEGLPRRTFAPPEGVVRATVCAPTGLLPGEACPAPMTEWFLAGTEPTQTERYYVREGSSLAIAPLAEARAWALEAGWRVASEAGGGVAVVQPAPGAVLYRAPELHSSGLVLRASVPPSAMRVEFYVDGMHAGTGDAARPQVEWTLDPGVHELRVVAYLPDGGVAEATSAYEVAHGLVREAGTR